MNTTGLQFIDDVHLKPEQRVFIRCDFNVPMDDQGRITDDARIQAALPTIKRALNEGASVVMASHLGRPNGQRVEALSMKPIGERLSELLKREVLMPDDIEDDHAMTLLEHMRPNSQVMLLENLRFYPGEKKNDSVFAQRLARMADVYINDAFGTSHRAHASTYGMGKYFIAQGKEKAAGFLLKRELENLGGLLKSPERPFWAMMGGAKVSDKLGVLTALIDRVQGIMIGGAMAYTFLKAQGHDVGNSRVEEDLLEKADYILRLARAKSVEIHLPLDHVVVQNFNDEQGTTTPNAQIPAGTMGLDIGPKTRAAYANIIANAGTVFWNGPMGVFEREAFSQGTLTLAHALANSSAKSVIGGGDSASAAKVAGVLNAITHVSTGGGASLAFIEGKSLPGVEGLRINHPFNLG